MKKFARFAVLLTIIAAFALTTAALAQSGTATPDAMMAAGTATPEGMMAAGTATPESMMMAAGTATPAAMMAAATATPEGMMAPSTLPTTGSSQGVVGAAAVVLAGALALGAGLRAARRPR